MKILGKIGACAILATGVVTTTFGQLQIAGNLHVSIDAVGLPVGPISSITNIGVAGGIFQSHTNNTAAVGPQVIAVGGNGTHGVLFDGECELAHEDGSGNAIPAPTGITGHTTDTFIGFSVEAWVFAPMLIDDNPVVSWGTRGNCDPNQVSCAYGSDASWGGLAMWCNDHGWGAGGTPAAGSWHHLAWTLDASGNENLYADGVLKAAYTGVTPAVDANNNILIGGSHANTGGSLVGVLTGGEIVGRVRIMDGILTGAQVANNYTYEAATFTNGTPTFLAAQPLHRYSFINVATNDAVGLTVVDRGTASNTVKAVNAIVKGVYGGATAQFSGSALTLAGGSAVSAPYVDLTNAMVSPFSTNNGGSGTVTYEAWVNFAASGNNWGRIFDFGDNTFGQFTNVNASAYSYIGTNYVTLAGVPGTDANNAQLGFLTEGMYFKSHVEGTLTHIAVTWNDANQVINVFENGVQISTLIVTNRMAGIQDVNNWLGRSNWSPDSNMAGSLYEFRVFNRLVTPQELLNDYQVGPTVTSSVLKWNGILSGNWDVNNTANWLVGATPVKYNDGGTVQFDDTLTGTTNVNVTTVVQPATLTVNNTASNYVFSGSGSISGGVGLTKTGNGTLAINNANNYTGITALNGGTLIVTNLANGGTASAIGAASSAPANISLASGTLSYRGPATSINRGYSVSGTSTLDVQGNLAISGLINGTSGNFTKSGAATLTYNGMVTNKLSGGDYYDNNGTVVIDGTAGQSNIVSGQIFVGSDLAHSATLILTNTSIGLGSWFAIARGNGSGGYTSTANLYNTLMTVVNLSLGYANGVAGNNQVGILTLNSNSWIRNTGGTGCNISESAGSVCTVAIKDNSWLYSQNRVLLGLQAGATGNLLIANNGAFTNAGYTSIGAPGNGNLTLQDNAVYQGGNDFNVTDTAGSAATPSVSTLTISNNATLIIPTLYVAKSAYCTATINQSGGTFKNNGGGDWRIGGNVSAAVNQFATWNLSGGSVQCGNNFQPGAYGTGVINQSGGTVNLTGGYPSIGRFPGANGTVNISGGSFNQLNSSTILIVGEQGTGTLNVSGTGAVNVMNRLGVGWNDATAGIGTVNLTNGVISVTNNVTIGDGASGAGTVNLYGGTMSTRQVITAGGTSYLNFYGGTLQAMPNANANFLAGLSSVTIYSGGAKIDSGTNAINIAQDLYDGGSGNLTKLGAGTLTLSGNQYYAGPLSINAGTLALPAGSSKAFSSSAISVADTADLDVQLMAASAQVGSGSLAVTLGNTTGASVNFDLGSFGNPGAAPLYAGGTLTKNGTTTVNITGTGLTLGEFHLIQFGALAGSGNFVLGSLPPGVVAQVVTNGLNIDLNITAVNILVWDGLNGGAWDNNSSIDWTNILSGLPAAYTQGSSVVFDDTVAGTSNVNLTITATPSSVAFSNSVVPYTIAGAGKISGPTGVGLFGTGAVTLSTTNNNYSGTTLVTGGSLSAGVSNALSPNSPVLLQNAALKITNNQTVKSLTASNAVVGGTSGTLNSAGFSLENTPVNVPLAGTGSLTTVGTNNNTELVTVLNNNTYSGQTVIGGGTLAVTNIANGGSASSLGASSSSPTNLVLAGGTLVYQGPGASSDRGYTVTANSTLDTEGNLALSGQISASGGAFTKAGPATLTINGAKMNQLSAGGGGAAVGVANGTMIVDGTAGQTNTVIGDVWVGFDTTHNATMILTNTVLTNTTWLAVGRGNGAGGYTSTLALYNSTLSAGDVSFGYANGIAGNNQNCFVTLTNNSRLINTGGSFNFTESSGSSSTVTISDTSWLYSVSRILIGMGNASTGTLVVANSGTLTNGGWVSIGDPGTGTATLQNNAVWQALTDFNVTDVAADSATPSVGTLNVQDNATLLTYTLYVGKGTSANWASGSYCNGTVNQSGGTVVGLGGGDWRIGGNNTTNDDYDSTIFGTYNLSGGYVHPTGNLQVGSGGNGEWSQSGGTAVISGYPSIGRYGSSIGQADISGGSFSQTNVAAYMVVGESGQGTLNLSGTGLVYAAGGLDIGQNVGGAGVVNLNGGTLSVSRVFQGNNTASGTFNFNGGLLQALPGSYPGFMSGLSVAYIQAGGANIDSGANSIIIAQPLQDNGGGGLTKFGSGILQLAGANTYTGNTVISNGTLLVNGIVAGAVNVAAGTLGGVGEIDGAVTVNPLGKLAPGNSGIGTLTNYNTLTLHGTTVMEISRNSGVLTSDQVTGLTQVNYGGALTVNNVGPEQLHVGDTFQLFSAGTYAGSFASVSLPAPYIWATNLAIGTIQVTGLGVATNPTNILATVVGGNLQISWPADHTGWRLQMQTNSLAVGLSTNWTTVAGSTTTNQVSVPLDSTKPAEFFRLVLP